VTGPAPRAPAVPVEIRDIRKRFGGGTPALDAVTLSIRPGEFLALLGPSGSGKTTLLRILAGLEFADSGALLIGGRSMRNVPARERGIGFVFQQYALFRHMSVGRNVAFGLDVRPRSARPAAAEIRRRVQALLDLMEIGHLIDRYPDQLSGGQRQRVALARALAIEPSLLLLDEPFGALDAKVRKSLRIWLRKLHDQMGLTSVFVTHDQAEAMEMADRIAVLRDGRIEQVDTPATLYAEPASAFVHDFMGESVSLPCTVRDGAASVDGLADMPPIPTDCRPGPAVAVVRPHEIGLRPGPGPARVLACQIAGPMRRVLIGLGAHEYDVLVALDAWSPGVGDNCGVDLSRARVYPVSQ
jgi:sulfate transport system ATP-binding protein